MTSIERKRASDLVFRVLFSLIFVVAGLGHFGQHDVMLARLEASPAIDAIAAFGAQSLLLYASGVTLVVGGVGLLVGLGTRWAAGLLLVTLVPITLSLHLAPGHTGPLLKNVALLGGLVHFAVRGPGAFALDHLVGQRVGDRDGHRAGDRDGRGGAGGPERA